MYAAYSLNVLCVFFVQALCSDFNKYPLTNLQKGTVEDVLPKQVSEFGGYSKKEQL